MLFKLTYWDSNYYNNYNKKEEFYLAPDKESVIEHIKDNHGIDLTGGEYTKHYSYDEESTTYRLKELNVIDLTLNPVSHYSSEYY